MKIIKLLCMALLVALLYLPSAFGQRQAEVKRINDKINARAVFLVDINGDQTNPTVWASGTLVSGTTSAITDTTSTQIIAGVASNYLYITQCTVSNSDGDTSTDVALQNGNGGTTLYTIPAALDYGGTDSDHLGWSAGSGYMLRDNPNSGREPDQKLGTEDRGPVSAGTYSGGFTINLDLWVAAMIAYAPAGSTLQPPTSLRVVD